MSYPKRVIMIAAECAPFAKAGGLGDVMGALPAQLERLGLEVAVVIPRHRVIDLARYGFEAQPDLGGLVTAFGFEQIEYDVQMARLPGSSVAVYLIGNERFFDRDGIYMDTMSGKDYADQADRWIFFNRAVMDFLQRRYHDADIVHCHDHQTALIPAYLAKSQRSERHFPHTGTVFTIHNLGYQGLFERDVMWRTGFSDAEFYPASPFEFYGMFNFMKVGISYADLVTTVSPTYAREIQESREFGYGLEGVLRERSSTVIGILNGIDVAAWNPETDPLIGAHYGVNDLSGKLENKRLVLERFGLDQSRLDWPLLAMISRIDVQKGFDLVVTILDYLLATDVFFVLLGTGNRETEGYLRGVVDRHRSKASIQFAFDNQLAHLTEAGADIFLMPSKYEPCGLNQMYSLRYGTVPVVRSTGGLADTVTEFDPFTGEGNGFRFDTYRADEFRAAVERALAVWSNRGLWRNLMLNGMQSDYSWEASARSYLETYERLTRMKEAG